MALISCFSLGKAIINIFVLAWSLQIVLKSEDKKSEEHMQFLFDLIPFHAIDLIPIKTV